MTVQGFPSQQQPFVAAAGRITQPWMLFLQGLWNRTGGAPGVISTVPTGTLGEFAAGTAPNGWLACDGSPVSRSTYSNLFAVIGTTWGVGDGTTTFNLPDLTNSFTRGSGTEAVGGTGGAASVALTTAQLPAHNHGVGDPGHTHVVTDPTHTHAVTDPGHHHTALVASSTNTAGTAPGTAAAGNTGTATTGLTVNAASTGVTNQSATTGVTTTNTGSGSAVPTVPPYAVVLKMIKS